MKTSEKDCAQFLAEPPGPLVKRLMRRRTHALGIIDVYHTQKRHARIVGWLESRFPLLAQLMQRCGSGDGQLLETRQMIYQTSFGTMGGMEGIRSNLPSGHIYPNTPLVTENFPTNTNYTKPLASTLQDKPENHGGNRTLVMHDDTTRNQEQTAGTKWRVRRATAARITPTSPAEPDNPAISEPPKATTIHRKASSIQPLRNIPENVEKYNVIQQVDSTLQQHKKQALFGRLLQKPTIVTESTSLIRQSGSLVVRSSKALALTNAEPLPITTSLLKGLPKGNENELSTYALSQLYAFQGQKTNKPLANFHPPGINTSRTQELVGPEVPKPDLFTARSPKDKPTAGGNMLIQPEITQTNSKAVNNLRSENPTGNSFTAANTIMANQPAVSEVIMPNTQTISPRFSKKEWAQLIESVTRVIWDKLLADLDRRGTRVWR